MADPLYRQYVGQARRLARLDPQRPRQGNLRRAVSTTYYAMFHYLVDQACRCVLGTANDRRGYRDVLARAFQHRTMEMACKSFGGSTLPANIRHRLPATFTVHPDLQSVAQVFRESQRKRYLADYDPGYRFKRSDVLASIRDVEEAIGLFSRIRSQPETKFFLGCLLAWDTLTGRR